MPALKKKICFVLGNRAHYARIKPIIKHLAAKNYRLVLFEAAALSQYGNVAKEISDDLPKDVETDLLFTNVSGGNLVTMTKSTGLALVELASNFLNKKPDVVVVVADRYEALAAAVAARYMNIPVAHIQGGENTGSIDDSVRHAITKLANLHFVSNEDSADRVKKMGEEPSIVYNTGCPTLDLVASIKDKDPKAFFQLHGDYEKRFQLEKKYIVVTFHPVTTEYEKNDENFEVLLKAIDELGIQAVWLYPNIDAGSDLIAKRIQLFKSEDRKGKIHFFKHFPAENYLALIKGSLCLVGNSSVVIRESALLGTPSVNIGTRQIGRLRGRNVIDCKFSSEEIKQAVKNQVAHGPYEPDFIYGSGNAGERIAKILVNSTDSIEKRMTY